MKLLTAILLTAILGFAAPLFLPWYSFAITSLLIGMAIHQKPLKAWLAGFLGLFLLWGLLSLQADIANNHLLSAKVAAILPLGGNYWALIALTAVIGGLVSGFAALTGCYVRTSNQKQVENATTE
jgi:hypothetical protein